MVFYVIAAAQPGADEADNMRGAKAAMMGQGGRELGKLFDVKVCIKIRNLIEHVG